MAQRTHGCPRLCGAEPDTVPASVGAEPHAVPASVGEEPDPVPPSLWGRRHTAVPASVGEEPLSPPLWGRSHTLSPPLWGRSQTLSLSLWGRRHTAVPASTGRSHIAVPASAGGKPSPQTQGCGPASTGPNGLRIPRNSASWPCLRPRSPRAEFLPRLDSFSTSHLSHRALGPQGTGLAVPVAPPRACLGGVHAAIVPRFPEGRSARAGGADPGTCFVASRASALHVAGDPGRRCHRRSLQRSPSGSCELPLRSDGTCARPRRGVCLRMSTATSLKTYSEFLGDKQLLSLRRRGLPGRGRCRVVPMTEFQVSADR